MTQTSEIFNKCEVSYSKNTHETASPEYFTTYRMRKGNVSHVSLRLYVSFVIHIRFIRVTIIKKKTYVKIRF